MSAPCWSNPTSVTPAWPAGRRPGRAWPQVEVRQADASLVTGFADALPADVLLLCGIFGNVSDRDIQRTIRAAPALCRAGATVIWTRHRRAPDLTPQIREWFAAGGFAEIAFDALPTSVLTSVGVSRLGRAPAAGLPRAGSSPSAVHEIPRWSGSGSTTERHCGLRPPAAPARSF